MMPKWMIELSKPKNNEEFSQLVHDYFKLATMRIMQTMRAKLDVPQEEIGTLLMAIFARMLNEGVYAVRANIKDDYGIDAFFTHQQLLNLVKVLNGDPLNQMDRSDMKMHIEEELKRFQQFILDKAGDFYVE